MIRYYSSKMTTSLLANSSSHTSSSSGLEPIFIGFLFHTSWISGNKSAHCLPSLRHDIKAGLHVFAWPQARKEFSIRNKFRQGRIFCQDIHNCAGRPQKIFTIFGFQKKQETFFFDIDLTFWPNLTKFCPLHCQPQTLTSPLSTNHHQPNM